MATTEKNILQVGQAGQTQQTKKTEQTQATEQFPTPGERNQTFEFLAVILIVAFPYSLNFAIAISSFFEKYFNDLLLL